MKTLSYLCEKEKEWLKTIQFKGNGNVPCQVVMDRQAALHFLSHRENIEQWASSAPHVEFTFPTEKPRQGKEEILDKWGCRWLYNETSNDGQVIEHPLRDPAQYTSWKPPEPASYFDWKNEEKRIAQDKKKGKIAWGYVEHGFFYLKLTYLRGYENLLLDIGEEDIMLADLIGQITEFWQNIIHRWADVGADGIFFGDDLGMQHSLPMSPASWRKFILPSYKIFGKTCQHHNLLSSLHTDGYIIDIIPDLITCGFDILNPQDLVNGLDRLAYSAKGKIAIMLDIDRQKIIPFGTPEEIDAHILNCIKTLGSPQGGLLLIHGIYTGVPLRNIEALFKSMEKYHNWWTKKITPSINP
jgi:uroporphyrinogen decarboxylase